MNSHADTANETTTAVNTFQIAFAAHNIDFHTKRKQLITDFLAGMSEQEQLELVEDLPSFDIAEALAFSDYPSVREALLNEGAYIGALVTIAYRDDISEAEQDEASEAASSAISEELGDAMEDLNRVLNGDHGYSPWVLDDVEKLNA